MEKSSTEITPDHHVLNEKAGLSSSVDLINPEILPCSTLRGLLLEKKLVNGNVQALDKPALVKLFYKTILPLPQRKYRANRKGAALTANQQVHLSSHTTNGKPEAQVSKRPHLCEERSTAQSAAAEKSKVIKLSKRTPRNSAEVGNTSPKNSSEEKEPVTPSSKKHARITWP